MNTYKQKAIGGKGVICTITYHPCYMGKDCKGCETATVFEEGQSQTEKETR